MYPEYISPNNSMKFISENDGETYNMCHCTSSLRSLAYPARVPRHPRLTRMRPAHSLE